MPDTPEVPSQWWPSCAFPGFGIPGPPKAPEAMGEDGTTSMFQVESPRGRKRKTHSQRLAEFRVGVRMCHSWIGRQREQGRMEDSCP